MKRFGWGEKKGDVVSTKITLNFIVSLHDMVHILAEWSERNRDQVDMAPTLSVFQIEQIIRRAYMFRGERARSTEWANGLTDIQVRRAYRWAQRQAKSAFPEQYGAAKKEGWL